MKQTLFILLFSFFLIQCNNSANFDAKKLNIQGLQYLQKGEEYLAIYSFKSALKIGKHDKPEETNFWRNLGIAYKQRYYRDTVIYFHDSDSAKNSFLTAANLNDKNSFQYQINMADAYLVENKINTAIMYLENAWRIDKNNISVNNVLGLIYLGENGMSYFNPSKALEHNLKAYKLSPNRLSKYVVAKNYFYLKNYLTAETLFVELFKEDPHLTEYLVPLVLIERQLGKKEDSEKFLNILKAKNYDLYKTLLKD